MVALQGVASGRVEGDMEKSEQGGGSLYEEKLGVPALAHVRT
jgi:hypothetical protein